MLFYRMQLMQTMQAKPPARRRVIPDIGRAIHSYPTLKDIFATVHRDDILRTIELHPYPLQMKLYHKNNQFYLSISAEPPTEPSADIKPIYAFMERWGQTAYLYHLLHEVPLEGTMEFQLPMHHAIRDPSNNTTL